MDSIYKLDNDLIAKGIKPKYIVWSEKVGCPFVSAELAIKWHNDLLSHDVETRILDLTEYDWEENPFGFRHHDLSTQEEHPTLAKVFGNALNLN